MQYDFQSKRLGFRNWQIERDLPIIAQLCADTDVMKYFPFPLSMDESAQLLSVLTQHYDKHGYTYYAVDELESGKLTGFIGLKNQTYKAYFNPSIDIGWRLARTFWGKGYATEGAIACLEYGFEELDIPEIVSVAPEVNTPSISIMRKIGMKESGRFAHPALLDEPRLQPCMLYTASANEWNAPA